MSGPVAFLILLPTVVVSLVRIIRIGELCMYLDIRTGAVLAGIIIITGPLLHYRCMGRNSKKKTDYAQ